MNYVSLMLFKFKTPLWFSCLIVNERKNIRTDYLVGHMARGMCVVRTSYIFPTMIFAKSFLLITLRPRIVINYCIYLAPLWEAVCDDLFLFPFCFYHIYKIFRKVKLP